MAEWENYANYSHTLVTTPSPVLFLQTASPVNNGHGSSYIDYGDVGTSYSNGEYNSALDNLLTDLHTRCVHDFIKQ